jgi:hypothetical protein
VVIGRETVPDIRIPGFSPAIPVSHSSNSRFEERVRTAKSAENAKAHSGLRRHRRRRGGDGGDIFPSISRFYGNSGIFPPDTGSLTTGPTASQSG